MGGIRERVSRWWQKNTQEFTPYYQDRWGRLRTADELLPEERRRPEPRDFAVSWGGLPGGRRKHGVIVMVDARNASGKPGVVLEPAGLGERYGFSLDEKKNILVVERKGRRRKERRVFHLSQR